MSDQPPYLMLREFAMISDHYGMRRAERSGVLLINHIREGLAIIQALGGTLPDGRAFSVVKAQQAFCLHPIFQADADLTTHGVDLLGRKAIDPFVLMLVMEYRSWANAWLSDKVRLAHFGDGGPPLLQKIGKPSPGPIPEVAAMLIADKVQNHKDFLIWHAGTHERSRELSLYFCTWLEALGIDPERRNELFAIATEASK